MNVRAALLLLVASLGYGEAPGTGLQISVAGDLTGNFLGTADGRFAPREAEVLLYAPIDTLFDGVMNLAAHNELGTYVYEIHELYLGSTRLIPRSRFRVGQFFLGFGRLNQFHRHDWPFTSAPKVQTEFFHSEGLNDAGLEYSYLFPTALYLDLTVGVTNGWVYGHAHDMGNSPKTPLHYLRLSTYQPLFAKGGLQTGVNYLGHTDSLGFQSSYLGLDLTMKWRELQSLKFLLQSEVWYRIKTPPGLDSENTLGFYIYPEYGISQSLGIGLRLDGYSVVSKREATLKRIGNFDYGLVPTLSYRPSEFSVFRVSYNLKGHLEGGVETNAERFIELQAVFLLGSHPAHDF